jgi:hypothetical protein
VVEIADQSLVSNNYDEVDLIQNWVHFGPRFGVLKLPEADLLEPG